MIALIIDQGKVMQYAPVDDLVQEWIDGSPMPTASELQALDAFLKENADLVP